MKTVEKSLLKHTSWQGIRSASTHGRAPLFAGMKAADIRSHKKVASKATCVTTSEENFLPAPMKAASIYTDMAGIWDDTCVFTQEEKKSSVAMTAADVHSYTQASWKNTGVFTREPSPGAVCARSAQACRCHQAAGLESCVPAGKGCCAPSALQVANGCR